MSCDPASGNSLHPGRAAADVCTRTPTRAPTTVLRPDARVQSAQHGARATTATRARDRTSAPTGSCQGDPTAAAIACVAGGTVCAPQACDPTSGACVATIAQLRRRQHLHRRHVQSRCGDPGRRVRAHPQHGGLQRQQRLHRRGHLRRRQVRREHVGGGGHLRGDAAPSASPRTATPRAGRAYPRRSPATTRTRARPTRATRSTAAFIRSSRVCATTAMPAPSATSA